jgi:DNA-binding transcriptional ArsR family regulator
MGATKHEIHSKEINELANLFKALSNPARVKALLILAENEQKTVTTEDFQNEIELSQSSISRHLSILFDSGLIATKIITRNKKSCLAYQLNYEGIQILQQVISKITQMSENMNTNSFYSKYKNTLNTSLLFKT